MTTPLDELFLWLGQPADGPEHLVMTMTDGGAVGETSDSIVYRPIMALSREHAEELRPLAQQAADGMGVTVVLREYVSPGAALGLPPLDTLEPRT